MAVKIPTRSRLNKYAIDVIPAIISLDMVSGMYDHMALRKTHSCGRNGNSERRVFHALPVQHRTDRLSILSADRKMDFVLCFSAVVYNPVFLSLVLYPIRRFRTKTERLQ